MLRELLVAMVMVGMATCETTMSPADDVTGTGETMTTEAPITEFDLIITHLESSTSAIKFMWDARVPKWMKVKGYGITASKIGSDAIMTYPNIAGWETHFDAEDLAKDNEYEICVSTHLKNGTDPELVEVQTCFESFTIPYIRPDSLYVLFIVVAYILLMIIIGYVSWRCAVSKAQKEAEAAEAAEEEENEEDKKEN